MQHGDQDNLLPLRKGGRGYNTKEGGGAITLRKGGGAITQSHIMQSSVPGLIKLAGYCH